MMSLPDILQNFTSLADRQTCNAAGNVRCPALISTHKELIYRSPYKQEPCDFLKITKWKILFSVIVWNAVIPFFI